MTQDNEKPSRQRISKEHFTQGMVEMLNLLRQAGTGGMYMEDLLDGLNKKIGATNQEKKFDQDSVNRMFATLKKHKCDYTYNRKSNKYTLNDTTWQMPTEIFLSYADQIALRLGWDILLKSTGSKSNSSLQKQHDYTMKKLLKSIYTRAIGTCEQKLTNMVEFVPKDEQTFLALSFALKTGTPITLTIDDNVNTRTQYVVDKLELTKSGWQVKLSPFRPSASADSGKSTDDDKQGDDEMISIHRISFANCVF